MSETVQPRTLYVVSTPIGNLEDISNRAVTILRGVDVIAAEDTRTTRVLLQHHAIDRPLVSYYMHNELRRVPDLIARLAQGGSVAIVTDAGTPGISDPAYTLIRAAIDNGIRVVPVPGASALLTALVASGLPTDRFVFEGFLPHKKGRQTRLTALAKEPRTIVLYEAPHRIERTLQDLVTHMGERRAALAREMTKMFEEVRRGTLPELLAGLRTQKTKGEMVLVIEGLPRNSSTGDADQQIDEDARHG